MLGKKFGCAGGECVYGERTEYSVIRPNPDCQIQYKNSASVDSKQPNSTSGIMDAPNETPQGLRPTSDAQTQTHDVACGHTQQPTRTTPPKPRESSSSRALEVLASLGLYTFKKT